jgi:N-dimethylarginine dimethylaminohydrolase
MLPDGRALLGYGYRSDRAMASHLARFLDREVTPLGLANPHLYHLDMALAVLDEQTALVCEAAFDAAALPVLRRALAGYRVLSVTLDEAMSFAVNCVTVGTSVLKAMRHPRIDTALERWGYHVVTTPLGEFHRAGGSAACLVSRVHLLPPLAAQRNAS